MGPRNNIFRIGSHCSTRSPPYPHDAQCARESTWRANYFMRHRGACGGGWSANISSKDSAVKNSKGNFLQYRYPCRPIPSVSRTSPTREPADRRGAIHEHLSFHGSLCAGRVHFAQTGQYRRAERRRAVRTCGKHAACGRGDVWLRVVLLSTGLGLHELLGRWPYLTRITWPKNVSTALCFCRGSARSSVSRS